MGSDEVHGLVGWLAELGPGLLEAILFEAMVALFGVVATAMVTWQNWRTREHYDAAFANTMLVMELTGMFSWYFFLAFYFVPTYDGSGNSGGGTGCPNALEGAAANATLGFTLDIRCIKAMVHGDTRLTMMRNYLVMPFVVNQVRPLILRLAVCYQQSRLCHPTPVLTCQTVLWGLVDQPRVHDVSASGAALAWQEDGAATAGWNELL